MEQGLTVEQIASRQRTTLDNARNYVRGTEAMLRGELPTAPSMAVKASRGYRYLLGCNLSPELRNYVIACLRQLAAINPEIRVEEPFRPGTLSDTGTRARPNDMAEKTACPACHMFTRANASNGTPSVRYTSRIDDI